MQAYYQSAKFPGRDRSCDFSKLPLEARHEEEHLCKALHFREGRHAVRDAALRLGTASAQAQNLDRDVIRAPAFASQFDQLAARLLRAFVFHGVKNLRVSYLPPQSVTADQKHVLWAQRFRSSG